MNLPLEMSSVALLARRSFEVTTADLTVGAVSGVLVLVCVLFHYEAMSTISRALFSLRLARRLRVVVVILTMMLAHVCEVWFFGLTYWWLEGYPELGGIEAADLGGALDFIYFSVVTYTSLGLGDMVPHGAIRILMGTEALLGLGLITWTASFAFLEMQRDWAEFRQGAERRTRSASWRERRADRFSKGE